MAAKACFTCSYVGGPPIALETCDVSFINYTEMHILKPPPTHSFPFTFLFFSFLFFFFFFSGFNKKPISTYRTKQLAGSRPARFPTAIYFWSMRGDTSFRLTTGTRGLFLESPEKFSGPKSQLSNCNPIVLKS